MLETLTEKRATRWAWTPHVGGDVDGPENGGAPLPWDIPALPSKPFHTEAKAIEVNSSIGLIFLRESCADCKVNALWKYSGSTHSFNQAMS